MLIMDLSNFIVIDVKSTNLSDHSEILSCSIVNQDGELLLDELVKTHYTKDFSPIPHFHNITVDQVSEKGIELPELYDKIREIIKYNPLVLTYNANFDLKFFPPSILNSIHPVCVMNSSLGFISASPEYESPRTYLKLNNVAFLFDVKLHDLDLLTSHGDAELCRRVWLYMLNSNKKTLNKVSRIIRKHQEV